MKHRVTQVCGVALAQLLLFGCAGAVTHDDAGSSSDAVTVPDAVADAGSACPANLDTAVGTPCSTEGSRCGSCADACHFCNVIVCMSGRWAHLEVLPAPCDGGVSADAGATPCGANTCAAGQLCVHTVHGGGACRPLQDGGTCGPDERSNGTCCSYYAESFACAPRPAACDPAVSCGCAAPLCTPPGGAPGCPCNATNGSTVECGCFAP